MKRLTPYFFLLPSAAVFILFVFLPALGVIRDSFERVTFGAESQWVGWTNYTRLLTDRTVIAALGNSVAYLLVTPVLIVLSLGVAFLLNAPVRGGSIFRALCVLPVVTPMVVVGIMWKWIFNEDAGLFNYLLRSSGLFSANIHWLSEYPLNLLSVMGVTIWKGIGYYALIFLAGLLGVPRELEEAAELDGASAWQRIRFLTLPMLRPTIALVAIVSSIAALKVFDELYVVIPGAPQSEQTLVPLIYQTAFMDFRLGPASALGVLLFILVLAFSYVNVRFWKEA
jgi:putative chitobiose transport system permease protein